MGRFLGRTFSGPDGSQRGCRGVSPGKRRSVSAGKLLGGIAVKDHPQKARQASVTTYIGKAPLPPFLIVHGDKDRNVPMAQSVELMEALLKEGHEADFIKVKNADHGGAGIWNDVILDRCLDKIQLWLNRG